MNQLEGKVAVPKTQLALLPSEVDVAQQLMSRAFTGKVVLQVDAPLSQ